LREVAQESGEVMYSTLLNGLKGRKEANAGWGGPPARQRRERIRSSLLGKDDGEIRCPRILRIGFCLEHGEDPLESIGQMLAEEGYGSPEDLRGEIPIPDRPYICRPDQSTPKCTLLSSRAEVLRNALMLGLCTSQLYDPARPVIWTRSSLTRAFELFDPEGFYA
jgi:hypothetical protein